MKNNKTLKKNEAGVLRYSLKNGATLLVKEDLSAPVVSLNIWVEAGSIDEKPDERGMAHLIEHMIFKGTSNRGVGEISRQVEAAGGYLNAFTSFEHTCYYVVLPNNQIQKALDIEFDAYLHSTFDAGELAKEKEVVFEEMRMRQDDPWSWSWELLFHILFQRNPYHWPVIGDMEILKGVPREKLLHYFKTHYVPSNTVIAVVGNVSGPSVVEWVRKYFEPVRFPKPPQRKFLFDGEPKSLQVHLEAGDVQQIYLSLGFPSVPIEHPDSPALEILAAILGDGAASRLNLSLREKNRSADDVVAEYFSGKYGGAIVFQCLMDAQRMERCLVDLMVAVKKVSTDGIPESELTKVKQKLKASKIFEKQSMDGQAKTLGFWELQGGYELEEKFLKALGEVESSDLKRVTDKYIQCHRGSMVVYHPESQKVRKDPSYWQSLLQKGMDSAIEPPTRHRGSGEKVQKLKLKNGSSLWVKQRKNLPLVSIGVAIPGGFSREPTTRYGITTLMTRCLQKGTQSMEHERFANEIESLAAHLDTFFEKDFWGLTLDVVKGAFEKSFDLMLEAIYDPAFSRDEVEKEKKLQLAAIERLKDDPAEYAMLQSDLLTFTSRDYAHTPLGLAKTVSKLSATDVRGWHRQHLLRSPATWFAVGDYDPMELKHLLDRKLLLENGSGIILKPHKQKGSLKSKTLRVENKSRQFHIVLGLPAPSFRSTEYFPFRVLNTLLNGMGGRLFNELREKRSLAYSVFASHDAGALGGIYQIYVGCAPAKMEESQKELLRVLNSFVKGDITESEFQRAKTYMVGLYQVGFQSNHSQLGSFMRYELAGRGAALVEQFPNLIQKVSLTQVREVALKYLGSEQKTWVLLGPAKED